MFEHYLMELAQLDVKLFSTRHHLTEEIRERMSKIIQRAPKSLMKKDNQSILRYAYTKALAKGE